MTTFIIAKLRCASTSSKINKNDNIHNSQAQGIRCASTSPKINKNDNIHNSQAQGIRCASTSSKINKNNNIHNSQDQGIWCASTSSKINKNDTIHNSQAQGIRRINIYKYMKSLAAHETYRAKTFIPKITNSLFDTSPSSKRASWVYYT